MCEYCSKLTRKLHLKIWCWRDPCFKCKN